MKRYTSYLDSIVVYDYTKHIDLGPVIFISPTNTYHGLQVGDIVDIGIQRRDVFQTLDGGKYQVTESDIEFWNQSNQHP